MEKSNRIKDYRSIIQKLEKFEMDEIENGIFEYALHPEQNFLIGSEKAEQVAYELSTSGFSGTIESVIELFEFLLENQETTENGIVFTPKYIADYIVQNLFSDLMVWDDTITIIDPGCGCGIFLVSAIEYIHERFQISIKKLLRDHIFGIDINKDNVRRCKLVMRLLTKKYGEEISEIPHIVCKNSLKERWKDTFHLNQRIGFSYVIGNPPYVNPHDLSKDTIEFLKNTFETTVNGTFNIFYAFIEHAMDQLSEDGRLGFIVPNNFLTIKSALELRKYLKEHAFLRRILDFGENMVFKPVRTYNCILFLSRKKQEEFEYAVMDRAECIEKELKDIRFCKMPICQLDQEGWKLVNRKTWENLHRIENQGTLIKDFVRTGIATLKDQVYFAQKDQDGFFVTAGEERYELDSELIKPIYKIPELKKCETLLKAQRYIIFPYVHADQGYTIIPEDVLKKRYFRTYKYLLTQKEILDSRDKGKKNKQGWYAYGRTQGLNKYGKKLLFPTFSQKPKFYYVENKDTLFCNGYAVFENDKYELGFLIKVLNSAIMDYYVQNTSYSIEGGYYCYQKKYIEKFSLPVFTKAEIEYVKERDQVDVDQFLIKKYGLIF